MAQCFGLGKSTAIKVLKSGVDLHKSGVLSEDTSDIIEEATAFMTACYGIKSLMTSNMSEVRGEVWSRRMGGKTVKSAPHRKSFTPSKEAFEENVKRAHIQTAIWKTALNSEPPALDPVEFGWERDERTRCLIPVTVQPNVSVAPPDVFDMVKCGCATDSPCSTENVWMLYSYKAAITGNLVFINIWAIMHGSELRADIFCGWHGEAHCRNEHTRRVDDSDNVV